MKIILPKYSLNYTLLTENFKNEIIKNNSHNIFFSDKECGDYVVYWGLKPYIPNHSKKYGVIETGFFYESMFIDTIGNYQFSSLNTRECYDRVINFDLKNRKSAKNIIFGMKSNQQSKFNADYKEKNAKLKWDGIILALQNPGDRSILSVTTTKNYFEFVEECCKFYGKKLFVKFHPWNSGEMYVTLENIVKKYGCEYGKTHLEIINECEFVISYNSTFAIDCLLRGIPYVQYGLGTFFNSYGIIYSKGNFPIKIDPIIDAYKLCDFLIYNYCFNKNMNNDKMIKMLNLFSESNDMFPMEEEFCYGNYITQNYND